MEYNLKKLKNNKKKQVIFIILTIILSLGITLGAVNFIYYFNDQRNNSMETALITLNFTDKTGGNINLANTVPVIDEIGLENTPYEFTVTNTSKVPINVNFQIIENEGNTLPLGAIRYGLYINDELITKDNLANLDEDGNFYVFENVEPKEEITCKIVFWVDYYYENSNDTFSAKLKIVGESRDIIYEGEPTVNFVETIKGKYGTDNTLVAVNTEGTLYEGTGEIREYRYSGPTANNYVFFDTNGDGNKTDDEVWRIIGVFEDTKKDENGNVVNDASGNPTYEEKVKLVRNTTLTSAELPNSYTINGTINTIESGTTGKVYWNKVKTGTNYNDWTTAGLQYYLNTEQDESETPNPGYLSFLSEEAKELLSLTTYHLGNVLYGSSGSKAISAYTSERNSLNIYPGNQFVWNGYVGLLYPSDYGYSASNTYWTTVLYSYSSTAKTFSWMQQTANHSSTEWLLSPSSYDTYFAMYWGDTGGVNDSSTYFNTSSTRVVINLISSAKVLDAAGTIDEPYTVVIE